MKDSTLVVTDLDGTFVYDSQMVHRKDVAALKQIQLSASIAIATGRGVKEIKYIEQQTKINVDYYIAFNGAFVQDKTGHVLIDKPLSHEMTARLCQLFIEHDIIFDALDGEARWGNFQHEKPDTLWGMEFILLAAPYDVLRKKRIYKINIRPQKNTAQTIITLLEAAVPEVIAYEIGKHRIEVMRRDASKALGILACVADEQQIIAIGDASNDIAMFNIADVSYCIAHAPQGVRKYAQKTVPYFADAIYDLQKSDKIAMDVT